jgi:penicillin-binding protein 2
MFNRALAGLYPPGSTFKMVTALAALEAGVVRPAERIECEGTYGLADQTFRCWKRQGHGRCDLHKALRESCDVYFYELAHRCGINAIADMGRKLGLGQIFDCGLPQQKKGIIPDADWKKVTYRKPWLGGETVLAGIGQGYVLTSPLQLAVMTARIASGKMVLPTLGHRTGGTVPQALFPLLDIAPEHLDLVRSGMIAVVNEAGGTGGNAALSDESVVVAGKTGTSQVSTFSTRDEAGADSSGPRDHALFVSYFPADAPRYAISAIVEHGGGGGATAAPLVRDVIQYIIEDDPIMRSTAIAPLKVREG